jgi:4-hydroxy-tetrahydrodipicolinate synthase
MMAAFAKGDVEHARHLNTRLVPSHRFQSTDEAPNPLPAKAMLRTLGLPAGQCRLPLGPAPEGLENTAREVFSHLRG